MFRQMHAAVDGLSNLPGLRQWTRSRFRASFERGGYGGVCHGIFRDRAEAAAAAPATLPLGYDNDAAARMYRERLDRVYPADYPMILWLQKALADGAHAAGGAGKGSGPRVFDLGGHVGVSYYAYRKFMEYPPGMSWQVCDVPAVASAGRELARERDAEGRLSFTDAAADADGADVLFTSGCLQYLDETLAQRLHALARPPRWVLVNLLPLHEREAFWTVQSIGQAFCPYRIQRAADFFGDMEKAGYELLDKWENPEKRCEVKFEPAHSLDRYYGAAFRRKD